MLRLYLGITITLCVFLTNSRGIGQESYPIESLFTQISIEEGLVHALALDKECIVFFSDSRYTGYQEFKDLCESSSDLPIFLKEQYILLKVNTDNFDGYAYKKEYHVSNDSQILVIDPSEPEQSKKFILDSNDVLGGIYIFKKFIQKQIENFEQNPLIKVSHHMPLNPVQKEHSNSQIYQVQIGQYDNYLEAFRKCNRLKQKNKEIPLVVGNDLKNGKLSYRIFAGNFSDVDGARDFMKKIKSQFAYKSVLF